MHPCGCECLRTYMKVSKITISNRTKKKAEEIKEKYKSIEVLEWGERPPLCDIVVNTTSIGLKSDDKLDLDFSDCNGDKTKLFYDLIYNPKETNFLKEARLRGNKTSNGQKMFLYQAIHAFKIWTNKLNFAPCNLTTGPQ